MSTIFGKLVAAMPHVGSFSEYMSQTVPKQVMGATFASKTIFPKKNIGRLDANINVRIEKIENFPPLHYSKFGRAQDYPKNKFHKKCLKS